MENTLIKKILIITVAVVAILALVVGLLSRVNMKKTNPSSSVGPTTTEITIRPQRLSIQSIQPDKNDTKVATTANIIVVFNQTMSTDSVTFNITPSVEYDSIVQGQTLIITPRSAFKPNTQYSYTLSSPQNNFSQRFSFTTLQANEQPAPDSSSEVVGEERDAYDKKNEPDLFLYNQTPYSDKNFVIESEYVKSPNGHFRFIVSIFTDDKTEGTNDFINWAKSQGLADDQIKSLDIQYQ